jgi:hypothetical protein
MLSVIMCCPYIYTIAIPPTQQQLLCVYHFVAAVLDVEVEQASDSSVRVSWNAFNSLPEITGYRVYYSQIRSRMRQAGEVSMDITDPSQDFAVIDNLESSVQYQFQVVAIAMLGGMDFVSNRSVVDEDAMLNLTTSPTTLLPTPAPPGGEGRVNRSNLNHDTVILFA